MPYSIEDHEEGLHLHLHGKELEDIFYSAFEGAMNLLALDAPVEEPTITRTLALEADNETELLISFINQLLELSRSYNEVYTNIIISDFSETYLDAELEGFPLEEEIELAPKVERHEVEISQNGKGQFESVLVVAI
ncbi:MAG TPA: archease [Patescibacteria group bacterium]|nr:archease [Patescibacteria group bacterium]